MELFPACASVFSPYSIVGTRANQSCNIKCILLGNDHGEFNAMLVFQGRRAVFDLGGGRENHSVRAGGCSVTNLLTDLVNKNLHSLFIF